MFAGQIVTRAELPIGLIRGCIKRQNIGNNICASLVRIQTKQISFCLLNILNIIKYIFSSAESSCLH
jgi:hypothetical protein